ncbi:MAG: DUF1998 domain-containing protein, partial [Myxococcota bacterium]
ELPIYDAQGLETVPVSMGLGEISVVDKVVGYKKIKFHTHENVGYGDVRLPEMQKHTTAIWFVIAREFIQTLDAPRPSVMDALRGISNALHTVAAVGLMTDPRDIGRHVGDRDGGEGAGADYDPTLFIYDQTPGGVGLAPRLYEERVELWRRAAQVIRSCSCERGCPACVGPVVGVEDGVSKKELALAILDRAPLAPTIQMTSSV